MVFETILDNREKDLIFLSKRIQSQKNTRHVKKTSNMLEYTDFVKVRKRKCD